MESVSFTFNGVDTLVALITNAVPAKDYSLTCYGGDGGSTSVNDVAVTDTLTLTVNDITIDNAYPTIEADVYDTVTNEFYGATLFPTDGSQNQYVRNAIWTYDGVDTITVTLQVPTLGVAYYLAADGISGFEDTTPGMVATDAYQAFTIVLGVAPSGRFVVVVATDDPVYSPFGIRLFDAGVAGSGELGNPNWSTVYQRIYGWRLNISDDAPETVDPLLVSAEAGTNA